MLSEEMAAEMSMYDSTFRHVEIVNDSDAVEMSAADTAATLETDSVELEPEVRDTLRAREERRRRPAQPPIVGSPIVEPPVAQPPPAKDSLDSLIIR